MAITASKTAINIREKLAELDQPQGIKGTEVLRADTADEVRNAIGARGRRNLLFNGDFQISQRGITQTTSGYGSDDRWVNGNSSSTKTHTREAFTIGQTDVPEEPRYFSRTVVATNNTTTSFVSKYQRIEDVRSGAGQLATLSFYAKADSAKNIAVEFQQSFGTGGSPSGSVASIEVTTFPLTTVWTKHTVTINIPSIAGKTIGTDLNDYLAVNIWFDAGANFGSRTNGLSNQSGTFDIANVQLELGSFATDFEHRSYGEELALCQRYYYLHASGASSFIGIGTFISATQMRTLVYFPVTMRSEPALKQVTGTDYFNIEYGVSDSFDNFTAIITSGVNGIALYKTGMTSTTAGYSGVVRGLNTSSELAFDAEL